MSPSCTSASGPPTAASGATCSTDGAVRGAAHPRVGDPHHVGDALSAAPSAAGPCCRPRPCPDSPSGRSSSARARSSRPRRAPDRRCARCSARCSRTRRRGRDAASGAATRRTASARRRSGARLPRSTAMPPLADERPIERPDDLGVAVRRVAAVLPDRLAVDRQRVAMQQAVLAERRGSRRAGRRRSRSPPSGTGPTASDPRASARRGRSRPSPAASAATPTRPAIASRWMTALVEPPTAPLTRIAFSNASRVRICEIRTSCCTSSTMRRPARCACA